MRFKVRREKVVGEGDDERVGEQRGGRDF